MQTNVQLVNDNDQPTGTKLRAELDPQRDIYRVAILWVINVRGELLIAQRKRTKDHSPGKWGPSVAGTVEVGESYESNIYKEAEEEIGLIGVQFELGEKVRIAQGRNYFCQAYIAHADWPLDRFKLQEDEVEALAWISREQLSRELTDQPGKYLPSMPQLFTALPI